MKVGTPFIAVVLPILVGFILGNLDEDIREFLRPGQRLLIPFFAFPLGAGIDFSAIVQAGPPGVLLGIMTVIISGSLAMAALRLIGRRNVISGACEASTAGNAVATPAAVALADPAYRAVETAATAQVAASTVTTAILTPPFVILVYRWLKSRGIDPKREFAEDESQEVPEPGS